MTPKHAETPPLGEATIYTDGGCEPNPGAGGYGIVVVCGNQAQELSGGFQRTTNNRMEIYAAIAGLEALKSPSRVTLVSDSRYLVDAMSQNWAKRWKSNGWWRTKKERAVNADLWERLLLLCERHAVTFQWVKGHAGHEQNERCDVLAMTALKRPDLPVDVGYTPRAEAPASSPLPLENRLSPIVSSALPPIVAAPPRKTKPAEPTQLEFTLL